MTISDTTPRVQYTVGGGGQTAFTVNFQFFAVTDLAVYNGTSKLTYAASPSGATQYSVEGAGSSSGGTVTLGAAVASTTVTILRDVPVARSTDFPPSGPFQINSLNDALDKFTAMVGEREDQIKRAVVAPDTDPTTIDLTLPVKATRATKVLAFDSAGDPTVSTQTLATMEAGSTAAASSATAAASSATAAASSATTSGNSATASANSATAAAASAASIDLTTRGDLLKRGASASERLAIGGANTVLTTDGTDPAWSTITNAMLAGSIDLTNKVTGALPLANGGTGATSLAAANIVATNAQNTFTKAQVPSTYTAALSATSGVLDYDTYTNFIVTLAAGSNTLAAPTTEGSQVGQCGVIIFVQPASGSAATVSLHADYETAAAAGLVVSSANNDYDVVPYMVKADNSVLLGAAQLNFG